MITAGNKLKKHQSCREAGATIKQLDEFIKIFEKKGTIGAK